MHSYERTAPMNNYLVDPCGAVHITIGDAGNSEGLSGLTGPSAYPYTEECKPSLIRFKSYPMPVWAACIICAISGCRTACICRTWGLYITVRDSPHELTAVDILLPQIMQPTTEAAPM